MQDEVQFAGFGGQGIMLIGKLLAHSAMHEGREVCWLPSYGPEMRGGTAYCTVVLADRPIGSPVISNPRYLVVMNRPSLEKFGPMVKTQGAVVINSSLIPISIDRTDIDVLRIPCNDIAVELGDNRVASMVALGALLGYRTLVDLEGIKELVKETFGKKVKVLNINLLALERGFELGRAFRESRQGGQEEQG
ncbi:MAG: 2-oxoacid:acceptor oxidoreductase family protein [Bradymonadales bacterium]|nr:2-oxoacid:acceptor oxidoreductase family protein [Bradymonadales bacterium]